MEDNKDKELDEKIERTEFTKSCFEWVESLIPALIVSVLILTFVFRIVTVNGSSMENTLLHGDKLIVRNLFYKPSNGDIVVVGPMWRLDEHIIIKRIIAKGGQTFDINFDTGEVTVDGVVLDEPYIKEITRLKEGGEIPSVIPEGYFFVMGDNRNHSSDSRSYKVGLVSEDQIVGKAEFILFPFNRIGKI